MSNPDEEFIRKALANVEKAEKVQRYRRLALSVLAMAAAFWWAYQKAGPELGVEGIVIVILSLALAVSTAKVMGLINKNTKTILQAIADLRRSEV